MPTKMSRPTVNTSAGRQPFITIDVLAPTNQHMCKRKQDQNAQERTKAFLEDQLDLIILFIKEGYILNLVRRIKIDEDEKTKHESWSKLCSFPRSSAAILVLLPFSYPPHRSNRSYPRSIHVRDPRLEHLGRTADHPEKTAAGGLPPRLDQAHPGPVRIQVFSSVIGQIQAEGQASIALQGIWENGGMAPATTASLVTNDLTSIWCSFSFMEHLFIAKWGILASARSCA